MLPHSFLSTYLHVFTCHGKTSKLGVFFIFLPLRRYACQRVALLTTQPTRYLSPLSHTQVHLSWSSKHMQGFDEINEALRDVCYLMSTGSDFI
ncbi:hypothetical protein K443DRAFT_133695 [Laccaria amethystina LaAM-08-1]|uniref:Unplaced genomic scaffold K443scaffold_146, whole genome shotgun sequence n=1 Tax=Laccaria amethystina LaAM-08-1 TaxID=1095629 RepID=A0A0C9XPJ5_9AGAR|nr:hypothetical protein K443DRAFT_133695 [Laccaria amethystina LaAM-08-1]